MKRKEFEINVTMDAVFVGDEVEGYTCWAKARPDIIAEGNTLSEAIELLKNAIFDVFKYESDLEKNKKYNIINDDINSWTDGGCSTGLNNNDDE